MADKKDNPETGDGKKGGPKPDPTELAQRLPNGVRLIKQPSKNWQRKDKEDPTNTR